MVGLLAGLCIVLISVCIILYRYLRFLLQRMQQFTDNIDDLKQLITVYSIHLQQTCDSPTFFGDVTIENLLKHTKEIVKDIEEFNQAFLVEPSKESEETKK